MKRKIVNNVFTTRKSLSVLMTLLCCVFFSTNVNATLVSVSHHAAIVLSPSIYETVFYSPFGFSLNIPLGGAGEITYSVLTDNNPLTLYEHAWFRVDWDIYMPSYSDPISFPANGNYGPVYFEPLFSGYHMCGVGSHVASMEAWLSYSDNTVVPGSYAIDTRYFSVVVPEPATICLLGFGGLVLLRKRKA